MTALRDRAQAVLDAGEGMLPGPWQVTHRKDDFTVHGVIASGDDLVGGDMSEADALAIAATPEAHAVIRDLLAENARLQSAVESLQTLDKWVNNWLAQINRDIDDLERADIADDMASDWFGSGWGASYRDEITALTEGDTDD